MNPIDLVRKIINPSNSIHRRLDIIDNYFIVPNSVDKNDILNFFSNISPLTILIPFDDVNDWNTFKAKLKSEVYFFFNNNFNVDIILIKYPRGSIGKGIFAIQRRYLNHLDLFLDAYIPKLYDDILLLIGKNKNSLDEIKKTGILLQEYVITKKCNLQSSNQNSDTSKFFCFENNLQTFDNTVMNILKEMDVFLKDRSESVAIKNIYLVAQYMINNHRYRCSDMPPNIPLFCIDSVSILCHSF